MGFKFSKRSKSKLEGVHNDLIILATYVLATTDTDFSITEGLRTKEKQAQYVKEGKSKTMNSRHLTGHAIDVFPIGATWNYDDPKWKALIDDFKKCAKHLGIACTFGYDWGWDAPHIELKR